MSYRDDGEALMERLAALERQARRAEQLEQRVRELEQENQALRDAMASPAAAGSTPLPTGDVDRIYVDDRLHDYIASILSATRRPGDAGLAELEPYVVSGARPAAAAAVVAAARGHAADHGRSYVRPDDIAAVAPPVLRDQVILSARAEPDGVSVDGLVAQILDKVEVP